MSALEAIERLRKTRLDVAMEASAQAARELDAAASQEAQAIDALAQARDWLRSVQRGAYSSCPVEALAASCQAVVQRRESELAAAREQLSRCRESVEQARRRVAERDRALDKVHELQGLERQERVQRDERLQVAVEEDIATALSQRRFGPGTSAGGRPGG